MVKVISGWEIQENIDCDTNQILLHARKQKKKTHRNGFFTSEWKRIRAKQ